LAALLSQYPKAFFNFRILQKSMRPYSKPFTRTDHHPFKTCGEFDCQICAKSMAAFRVKPLLREQFFGSSPAPFVGSFGYPLVNVGLLSPPETRDDAWEFDAPRFWAESRKRIPEIVQYRSSLINSRAKSRIKSPGKLLDLSQQVGMASRPVDVEVFLKKRPSLRMSLDASAAPLGPTAEMQRIVITENPKIHTKVDKVHDDADLKAADALSYLYRSGFDENFLSRILSVGTVGIGANRKLVPTRFAITATDDTLGKQLIRKIRNFGSLAEYSAYFGSHLGNYFLILVFPEVWSYELFETLQGSSQFTTDYEPYAGRKAYVQQTAGGYFAARLPIVEKLVALRRQGSVLAIRMITRDYSVPLGVWVVREAARNAMQQKPVTFASLPLMLEYAKTVIRNRFGHDISPILERSRLLKNLLTQRKLTDF
jgi:DNA repair protein NreA